MKIVILILDAIEVLETVVRWLYCETVFSWKTERELKRLFKETGK